MRLANPGAAMKTLPIVGYGQAHGYLYIHSAPRVMVKNIEWSLEEALGKPCNLKWSLQPLNPGGLRCELTWSGPFGTGSRLASALRGWHYLIFELHEVATQGGEGVMYMHTPELGLFHSAVGPHGDLLINENQIKRVVEENSNSVSVIKEIENLVGKSWDVAIEPFRIGRENFLSTSDKLSV